MTRIKIRKDETGLFIKHGDEKARPVVNSQNSDRFSGEINGYRDAVGRHMGARICHDGISDFSEGETVEKYHISQTTMVRVKKDEIVEVWFLEGG